MPHWTILSANHGSTDIIQTYFNMMSVPLIFTFHIYKCQEFSIRGPFEDREGALHREESRSMLLLVL